MTLKLLIASAAIAAIAAGAATAATYKHAGGTYAEPSQPVAYAKLGAYLKASPSKRASGDWSLDAASAAVAPTGAGANVSAVAPDSTSAAGQTATGETATGLTTAAPMPAAQPAPAAQSMPDSQSTRGMQSTPGADQSTTSQPPATSGSGTQQNPN